MICAFLIHALLCLLYATGSILFCLITPRSPLALLHFGHLHLHLHWQPAQPAISSSATCPHPYKIWKQAFGTGTGMGNGSPITEID